MKESYEDTGTTELTGSAVDEYALYISSLKDIKRIEIDKNKSKPGNTPAHIKSGFRVTPRLSGWDRTMIKKQGLCGFPTGQAERER